MVRQVGKLVTATVTTAATFTKLIGKSLAATVTTATMVATFVSGGAASIWTFFFGPHTPSGGGDPGTPAAANMDAGTPEGGTGGGTPGSTHYDPPTPGQV